ncbi:paraneoplastic antigen-like protein 5 [Exaiptasia diaphana]|uniref:Paraneoplastic antigen Ma-like C-terminal domain-containing protein n=1 Tax=Exaiptasia diaphana TaxID=2652724 RepID=A0A913X427_EXADI|nr:paraneoplastic antigen-like protein 5 [Exaiptasia diaphana]
MSSVPQTFQTASAESLSMFGRVPRISNFSGNSSKSDVSFEAWKFEVKCLMGDHTCNEELLRHGVRKSLRGEAGVLCMHLGENATVEAILRKLEGVYGNVDSGTTLLQKFYNARQESGESVAEYGCRLEEVVNRAISRGAVAKEQANEMLKSKLWTGLKDERVRNATRYKYDMIHDFDELRAELRAMEQEIKELDCMQTKTDKPQRVLNMPQVKDEASGDSTKKAIEELSRKVKGLEDKMTRQPDTTKLLNRILEVVEKLELDERRNHGGAFKDKPNDNKPSNSKEGPSGEGRTESPNKVAGPIPEMLGDVNVSMCYVNDVPCLSLVDTGSQVSTICECFREEYLNDCPLRELEDILKIEGAAGQDVPICRF